MAMTKDKWVEEIKGMSVLDLSELVKALEGVTFKSPRGDFSFDKRTKFLELTGERVMDLQH